MPSAAAITRSSGVVMNPRTRSAFAPTYVVETSTTAISLRGYCRTLNERIDCSPAIRITRFTTIARTGRFINRSVNFMDFPCLAVLRFRSRIIPGLHFVVHVDRRSIAELENSRGHHFIPRVPPRHDRHLVTARPVNLHKLLAHSFVGLSLRILHFRDDEDRISIRRVADRRCRQSNRLFIYSIAYFHL